MTSLLGGGRRTVGVLGCVAITLIPALGLLTPAAAAADDSAPPSSTVAPEPDPAGSDATTPPSTVSEPTSLTDTTAPDATTPTTTVHDSAMSDTVAPDTTTTMPPAPAAEAAEPAESVGEDATPSDVETSAAPAPASGAAEAEAEAAAPVPTDPSAPEPSPPDPSVPPEEAEEDADVPVALAAIAPPVVTGVTATQGVRDWGTAIDRTVTVSWSGPSGADYEVERRLSTSSTWEYVNSAYATASTTDYFGASSAFGWYQYRVTPRLWDPDTGEYVAGTPGHVSVLVTRTIHPPSVPRAARATRTNSAVQVSWTAPTTVNFTCESTYFYCSPATSYVVSWAAVGGTWQSVTTTGTSRTISGLAAQTTYYVNVRAVNSAGRSAATPSIRVNALGRPGLVAMRATPAVRQVALTWTAPITNGSPITRYIIQRRLAGSPTWTYASTGTSATARSFTATGLASDTRYEFRILAVNGVGWGAWSSPIRVQTPSHQFDVNLILVGRERFTAAELRELNTALADARGIFAKVGIFLRVRATYGLTLAQAGTNLAIDNDAEAIALTTRWTFPGNALDLFVVRSYVGWTAGLSALGGSCNKNDSAWGAMTGAVVEVQQGGTGVILAHEAGHYLGLPHLADATNFMNPVSYTTATGIRTAQGTTMRGHCLMTRA